MKKILLILILSTSVSFAAAVSVTEAQEVIINGINAGRLVDVAKNHSKLKDEVESAIILKFSTITIQNARWCRDLLSKCDKAALTIPDFSRDKVAKANSDLDAIEEAAKK